MRTSPRHFGLPLAVLSAAALTIGLLSPVTASGFGGGQGDAGAQRESREMQRATRLEERATRARERLAARQQARSAREQARSARAQERAARRATRAQERAARRSERGGPAGERSAGSPAGREAGAGPATGQPADPVGDEAGGRCRATIDSSAGRITAGETVTLFGKLTCPTPISAAGRQLTVYAGKPGSLASSYAMLGAAKTETDGSYQLMPLAFDTNTTFRVRVGNHGARTVVKVAPLVTLEGPSPAAKLSTAGGRTHGGPPARVTFSGSVSPHDDRSRVSLQVTYAAAGEQWRTVAFASVGADGRYSVAHSFRTAGQASVRVLVHMRKRNVVGSSEPLTYEVAQAQNPRLTIQSSAAPVTYGQSVTITGVAAEAVNQPVTLLARTHVGSFAPVATATTDAAGRYEFTQAPAQNTVYRVTAGATASTALYEGVKRALAADPLTSAVQAGQQVTFTGTVSPAGEGQQVYAESGNAAGIFHVMASAIVTGSSYSISHLFTHAGSYTVRIRVPGDPALQMTTSAPFTLAVAPGPAAALAPEAPAASPGSA
jgi:hypothetical protein